MSDDRTWRLAPGARAMPAFMFGIVNLAGGLTGGLVTVALAYELAHRGVSAGEIAGLISVFFLPSALLFLVAPVVDLTLSPRGWCVVSVLGLAATSLILGFAPLGERGLPLIVALAFVLNALANVTFLALSAAMALTVPDRQRGSVSAWTTAGFWGGNGLGGGLELWIATHAGGFTVAAFVGAVLALVCGLPLLILRTPRNGRSAGLRGRVAEIGGAALTLVRTRAGVLAALAVTIPTGIGAGLRLLPAVSDHWRASADLVAVATGVMSGLAAVAGCVVGGYLADRFPRRPFFIVTGLAFAAVEAAFAFSLPTPLVFAVGALVGGFVLGVSYAAVNTVIYELLGDGAATVCGVLASLSNVPLVAMSAFVGAVAQARGPTAMLAAEAGVGVIAALAYAALTSLWRPVAPPPVAAVSPG